MGEQPPSLFLSYSSADATLADAVESALRKRKLVVWRDVRTISAGEEWFSKIEAGIRESIGVVVLLTPASAKSDWVTYEYALAKGARVPVVAVRAQKAVVPSPIRAFQIIEYRDPKSAARRIDEGILAQSHAAARERASIPVLLARFQEEDGEIVYASGGKVPSICIDLWMEGVPAQTRSVAFEILDVDFRDRKWTVGRKKANAREFLTTDMNSYGDVEIAIRGVGPGLGSWSTTSGLYEALLRYYRRASVSGDLREALEQIRDH